MGDAEGWFIEERKRKAERRNEGKSFFVCMLGIGILILINFSKRKLYYTTVLRH